MLGWILNLGFGAGTDGTGLNVVGRLFTTITIQGRIE